MRFIVECDTIEEAFVGLDAINQLASMPEQSKLGVGFSNGQDWVVRETKTGYSTKLTEFDFSKAKIDE